MIKQHGRVTSLSFIHRTLAPQGCGAEKRRALTVLKRQRQALNTNGKFLNKQDVTMPLVTPMC